jgi:subtilase family serine protease
MSKLFRSGLFQKQIGANEPIPAVTIKLGCTRGRGSSTRIFNYCKEHSPAPSLCIDQFVNTTNGFDLNNIYVGNFPNATKLPNNFAPQLGKPPYKPSDIKTAYSFPANPIVPSQNVRKAIITIIAFFHNPKLIQNLKTFCAIFSIRQPDPGQVKIYNLGSDTNVNPDTATESNADLQWAYAMNPYAQIRVIEAKSLSIPDAINAINYGNNANHFSPSINTDIMTMSFGIPPFQDFQNVVNDPLSNPFTNPYVCYLAASGDNNIPIYPAIMPNVLAIGATNLQTDTNYIRKTEAIWSKSGCGYTPYVSRPTYQSLYITNSKRSIPDLCAVGATESPLMIVENGTTYYVSGTSLSSPIVAGILSLVVQARLNINNNARLTTCDLTNPTTSVHLQSLLYAFFITTSCFFDVVQGKSGNYSATPGFDQASGLGVINVNNLIQELKNI